MYKLCVHPVYSKLLNSQNLIINVFIYNVIRPHFLRDNIRIDQTQCPEIIIIIEAINTFGSTVIYIFNLIIAKIIAENWMLEKNLPWLWARPTERLIFEDVFEKIEKLKHLQQTEDEIYMYILIDEQSSNGMKIYAMSTSPFTFY